MHDFHATEQMLRAQERTVAIPAGRARLPGTLAWPDHPSGLVLFAHGSGSGRRSVRNQRVARQLRAAGLGTLLFDLLTEEESAGRANIFDIDLLAGRLLAATDWVAAETDTEGLPLGYFGASTGAAAALKAAGRTLTPVQAVVCRGGRPDLAGEDLPVVAAPTLLIVGGRDPAVRELNRQALANLMCTKRLVVVPGATHLFEEPGTLEEAGMWAAEWFIHYLAMEPTWRKGRR
ncbi:MAG TPA: alpha/beta family hydrolase [Gemmatimonadales bacterium]|nr:alpha/beta family hydrolase [Gemmatimonadales bacterium]